MSVEKLQADPNEVMNWDIKDAQLDAWPKLLLPICSMALEYLPPVGLFLVGFKGHNFHTRLEDSGTYMNGLKFMVIWFFCGQMFQSHGAFWVMKGSTLQTNSKLFGNNGQSTYPP